MKGTERIWTSLTVKLIRGTVPSGTTDNIGPTVSKVALSDKPDGTVTAAVDATDPSGIAEIDVTQIGGTARRAHSRLRSRTPRRRPATPTTSVSRCLTWRPETSLRWSA